MDVSVRQLLLLLSFCAVVCGCRGPDPSIELLESELRWMEDQLYMLDDQLGQTCAQLEACRRENLSLQLDLEKSRLRQGTTDGPTSAGQPGASDLPSASPMEDPSLLEVPSVELPNGDQLLEIDNLA